jgi:hypothetical protein
MASSASVDVNGNSSCPLEGRVMLWSWFGLMSWIFGIVAMVKGDPLWATCGGDSPHDHNCDSKDEKARCQFRLSLELDSGQFLSLDSTVMDQPLELVEVGQMTWIMKAK